MTYPDQSDLAAVNEAVNALPYVADAARYHVPDFWERIDAEGGDCEDYALGKLNRLIDLGWPIAKLRLACCFTETGGYHAVLAIGDGETVLDNRQPRPVTISDLDLLGYKPDKIQREGGARAWVSWLWA